MHRAYIVALIIFVTVTACHQIPTGDIPAGTSTPMQVHPDATITPSPIPASTSIFIPTETPTASITSLPTIPTFTPTFDVSTIITVTPAPKAECPATNPTLSKTITLASYPSGQKYVDSTETILDYLNEGGKLSKLQKALFKFNIPHTVKDITNDGLPDVITIYGSSGIWQTVVVFWCNDGKYELFPKDLAEAETFISDSIQSYSINDLNNNGVPEILSVGDGHSGLNVNLLEWNGKTFVDLTSSEKKLNAWMPAASKDDFQIIDKDFGGIPELILKGAPQSWYYPGEPLRTEIDIYQWNGKTFSPITTFNSPNYRFQAIQDADRDTLNNKYDEALSLYQDAIFSDKLDWWSKKRFEYNLSVVLGTSTPSPNVDVAEYPRLAAYAYYRIMLLHLIQNHESDADKVYKTLQKKFGKDPYGQSYVQMATAFWNAYQSAHKMYDGCAAAIEYAAEHPEILTPLGSDYHGAQSHIYISADVCPFR